MLLLEPFTPTRHDSIPSNQNHFRSLRCHLHVSKSSPKINLTLRSGRVSLPQLSPFFASIFPLFPQKRLILRLHFDHFNFLRGLAPGLLDGFSIGGYEKKFESFDLFAAKFESGAMRFSGGKSLRRWSPFKTRIVLLLLRTVNGELKIPLIARKTAFEAKGRQYTTNKVIQRLFNIDLYTY